MTTFAFCHRREFRCRKTLQSRFTDANQLNVLFEHSLTQSLPPRTEPSNAPAHKCRLTASRPSAEELSKHK
jgi:hypothetical protein